jgi:hypothetical protein
MTGGSVILLGVSDVLAPESVQHALFFFVTRADCENDLQGPNPGMIGGSKLYVYEWMEEKLVGRAFFDAFCYVTSLKTIKSFVIMGDIRHSLHFLR